ncbi:glycosyltransferase [Streptomyces sp. NPDC048420]|uniref:glycosyltransferase n=1 Tax=Streptomyces sp. NPDC048420 TaxID=3155755 RepID=UPI0034383C66
MPKRPTRRRRITVVQPYVPHYRVPFFGRVRERLDAADCTLEVLHGPPPPSVAARRDAAPCAGAVQVPTRQLTAPGGRSLFWHQVWPRAIAADAVVLEQALHNLEAYWLLLRQRMQSAAGPAAPRIAFWGHGRTYTAETSRLQAVAKDAVTRRANWFFAYTERGAAHVAARGFPGDRITVLRNCVDTTELAEARGRADVPGTREHAEAAELRERHRLVAGRTALFVGGLDTPKRIGFLLECARRLGTALPGFRLLVAGDGADRELVAAAVGTDSPVVALGHRVARDVALLGAVSDVMLMPGRVGLCAVDSFALRTPILTTDWPWHAPEFEYLQDGRNAVVTRDDVAAYAAAVQALLTDRARLASLRLACREDAIDYTVDGMAARFCNGLLGMLERDA